MENYAGWIKKHEIKKCPEDGTDALVKGKIDIEEVGQLNRVEFVSPFPFDADHTFQLFFHLSVLRNS